MIYQMKLVSADIVIRKHHGTVRVTHGLLGPQIALEFEGEIGGKCHDFQIDIPAHPHSIEGLLSLCGCSSISELPESCPDGFEIRYDMVKQEPASLAPKGSPLEFNLGGGRDDLGTE